MTLYRHLRVVATIFAIVSAALVAGVNYKSGGLDGLWELISDAASIIGVRIELPVSERASPHNAKPLTIAEERTLKTGDSFKECEACPEMMVVPVGSFMMGSPPREEGPVSNGEQRRVTIARPFAVGMFEVTFAEWDACVASGGCKHEPGDEGWGRGKQPVINVSWNDITQQYLPWLSRKTGKAYRLLSEAEWEYVARAGTTTPFSWGSSISTNQANYNGNYVYGRGSKGEYRGRTLPVDSFAPRFYHVPIGWVAAKLKAMP
jgi:formylglycine-generating enzyme required for sulfatase activity